MRMEDDLNIFLKNWKEVLKKRKTTSTKKMEDDREKKMEDDRGKKNGRRPQQKIEDNLKK
jgi:hypothetical protein